MASTRGVNRGIFSALFDDPDYQGLPAEARLVLLTARLCKQAGAGAIFRFYPEVLARQCGLPVRRITAALGQLEAAGYVEVEGPILWVKNGLRYDPHVRLADRKHRKAIERAISELPRSDIVLRFCDYYEIIRPFEGSSKTDPSLALPKTEYRVPNPQPPAGQVRPARRKVADHESLAAFDAFWATYPAKVGKPSALRAWHKIEPTPDTTAAILAGVTAWSVYWRAHGTDASRIPYPATWLNDRRWEADIVSRPPDPYAKFPKPGDPGFPTASAPNRPTVEKAAGGLQDGRHGVAT